MIAAVGPLDPHAPEAVLLDAVQRQTLRYFWDFAHPVSGLARERSNATPDVVTSGGSGFGFMAILCGIERGWIERQAGLDRLTTTAAFLGNAERHHGAFPHWLDGGSGRTVRFAPGRWRRPRRDVVPDGGTSRGPAVLRGERATRRRCFATSSTRFGGTSSGIGMRATVPSSTGIGARSHGWAMNHAIHGWNECLITYLLAARSPTHAIRPEVYHRGYAHGPTFLNGRRYDGIAAAARAGWRRAAVLRALFVPRYRPARAARPLRRLLAAEPRPHARSTAPTALPIRTGSPATAPIAGD